MKPLHPIALACLVALGGYSYNANADAIPTGATNQPVDSLAPVLKKVMPSVVNIATTGELPFAQDPFAPKSLQQRQGPKFESMGSGVIVDAKQGYILTNAHVIRDSKHIVVTLNDGRKFDGKVIGIDDASDIAVVQIKAADLQAINIANSSGTQVGDFVIAIGSPFDLKQSVTSGIVSALGRSGLGIEGYENFIQTDAPINPGNSGGALVNMHGQLVGINTAILTPSGVSIGIGFAIPSNMASSVMDQLIKYGDVKRGMIGVVVQDFTPSLAQAFHIKNVKGAVVTQVTPNTPAAKSGIKVGDVIEKANGQPVRGASDVRNIVGLVREGHKVSLEALDAGSLHNYSLVTTDPSVVKKASLAENPYFTGVVLENLDRITPTQGHILGVEVVAVSRSSAAWRQGLRPGDSITSVNQETIHNLVQLNKVLGESKGNILLNVIRGPGAIFIVLK